MHINTSKVYITGNATGIGKIMVKPTSEKDVQKIYVRKGSTTILHKLYDKIKGIKVAQSDLSEAFKKNISIKSDQVKIKISEKNNINEQKDNYILYLEKENIIFSQKKMMNDAKHEAQSLLKNKIYEYLNKEIIKFKLTINNEVSKNNINESLIRFAFSASRPESDCPAEGQGSLGYAKKQVLDDLASGFSTRPEVKDQIIGQISDLLDSIQPYESNKTTKITSTPTAQDIKNLNKMLMDAMIAGLATDLVEKTDGYREKTPEEKASLDKLEQFESKLMTLFLAKNLIEPPDDKKSNKKIEKTNENPKAEMTDSEFTEKLKIAYNYLSPPNKIKFDAIRSQHLILEHFHYNEAEIKNITSKIEEEPPSLADISDEDLEVSQLLNLHYKEIAKNNEAHRLKQQGISDAPTSKNTQSSSDADLDELEKLLPELELESGSDELEEAIKDFESGKFS